MTTEAGRLQIELDLALVRLEAMTARPNPVEGAMRMRALSEIAEALDTLALQKLAVVAGAGGGPEELAALMLDGPEKTAPTG